MSYIRVHRLDSISVFYEMPTKQIVHIYNFRKLKVEDKDADFTMILLHVSVLMLQITQLNLVAVADKESMKRTTLMWNNEDKMEILSIQKYLIWNKSYVERTIHSAHIQQAFLLPSLICSQLIFDSIESRD